MSRQDDESPFKLSPREDPNQLIAIRVRETACEDSQLSDGAVRLFTRLLDLSLNPFLNNGVKGQIIVSQMKLACMLHCDERSIRRRVNELARANYVWTSLVGRQNTKPIRCYHISAFQPKRQAAQEMAGEGLWGNGKRRFDHGFERTGQEATGHQRRLGSGLLDRFGKQIFFNLPENAPVRGQERLSDRTLASSARGHQRPLPEDNFDRSQRTPASSARGQFCPLTEDTSAGCQRTPASAYKESQIESESPLEKGDGVPPQESSNGKGIKPDPDEAWRRKLATLYPRELENIRAGLKARLNQAGAAARAVIKEKIRAVDETLYGPMVDEITRPTKPSKPLARSKRLSPPSPAELTALKEAAR